MIKNTAAWLEESFHPAKAGAGAEILANRRCIAPDARQRNG
jgi:hypothetical protein